MTTYKLTYFPARVRGELIRLIFVQAGVEYENVRLPYYPYGSAEWAAKKETIPTAGRTLPILEVDGKVLSGHTCIARYLAEKYDLAGQTSLENCELAGIVDAVADGWTCVILAHFQQKNEELKAEKVKEVYEETLPGLFRQLDKMVKKNGSPDGWIWGNKLTYADLAVFNLFSHFISRDENAYTDNPNVAKLYRSVEELTNISKWLQERPQDAF